MAEIYSQTGKASQAAAERHLHRVTLFVCRQAKPGEPKQLEVFARAGRFDQSATVLRVDENRLEACEGIEQLVGFATPE